MTRSVSPMRAARFFTLKMMADPIEILKESHQLRSRRDADATRDDLQIAARTSGSFWNRSTACMRRSALSEPEIMTFMTAANSGRRKACLV